VGTAFFITGTDTGVGKTLVSAILGLALQNKRKSVGYFKPVETGVEGDEPEDAGFCKAILGLKEDAKNLCSYTFKLPASPHLSAEVEGKEIKVEKILEDFKRFKEKYEYLLVEGAGGLLVPLRRDFLIRDLIKLLNIPVILVARAGLGTINHTLLSVEAIRNYGLELAGIVFNQATQPLTIIEKDNIKTLAELTGAKVLGVIPKLKSISKETLLKICEKLSI